MLSTNENVIAVVHYDDAYVAECNVGVEFKAKKMYLFQWREAWPSKPWKQKSNGRWA